MAISSAAPTCSLSAPTCSLSALLLPLALYVIMERLSLQLPCGFVMSFQEDDSHVFEQWRRGIFSSP